MRRIVDTAYGADADGNRGITRISYEIEAEDEPQIKEQVQEYLDECGEAEDPSEDLDIVLFDPVTDEEVYFTIRVKDYTNRPLAGSSDSSSSCGGE